MILPITLCAAAAAGLINVWLALRTGQIRRAMKISVGDGGHEPLLRRMRAQLNFVEYALVFLVLTFAIELARPGSMILAVVVAVFMTGRVAHGIGMDGPFKPGRPIGTATALLGTAGLAIWAVAIALGR